MKEALKRTYQSVHLIWGDNDPDVPLRDGEALQQQMENSRLVVFKDCGHHPQEEYPAAFVEVQERFW